MATIHVRARRSNVSVDEARHAFVEAYLAALPETYDKEPWREIAVATFAGLAAFEGIKACGHAGYLPAAILPAEAWTAPALPDAAEASSAFVIRCGVEPRSIPT